MIGEAGAPRFITDNRTNSLIVIATASQLQQIQDLILLLDYERKGSGRLHVHRLQNADAEDMAATTRVEALRLGNRMMALGAFEHVSQQHELEDLHFFYCFPDEGARELATEASDKEVCQACG